MYPRIITSPVTVRGQDFFGRKAELTFEPYAANAISLAEDPDYRDWFWDNGRSWQHINPSILRSKPRRLSLGAQGQSLEIYEHIGPLRFAGLSRMVIRGTGWPPYFGRTHEFLQPLMEASTQYEGGGELPLYTVDRPIFFERWSQQLNRPVRLDLYPAEGPCLDVEVKIDFPSLGKRTGRYQFPDYNLLEKVCSIYTPGWPPNTRYLAKIASMVGWPHYDRIVWSSQMGRRDALEQFLMHRCQDLQGALSVLCYDGYFVGRVISECASHADDVQLIKMAADCIIPLAQGASTASIA